MCRHANTWKNIWRGPAPGPARITPSETASQVCYTEMCGFHHFGSEIKPIIFSHLEQAKDSTLKTTLLPGVIQTPWSHIYLLINEAPVLAEPGAVQEAQLQSSFPIYIPKKPGLAGLLALQPARCAVQVWEGDSAAAPTGYLRPVAPGASPAQAIPSTPK